MAAAEMSFAGGLGMELNARDVPTEGDEIFGEDTILFSESPTRFVVEVRPKDQKAFRRVMRRVPCDAIGKVRSDRTFIVRGLRGRPVIYADIDRLKEAWQAPLR